MLQTDCWICGNVATTGEHLIKKSDLVGVFGKIKPKSPLFLHNAKRTNHHIQGFNADPLKLPNCLCAQCNNQRTQPFDRAWEKFSSHIRNPSRRIRPGIVIRADRIYKQASNKEMRKVQLYFVKLFGCLIRAYNLPVPLETFVKAVAEQKFHPNVFIKLGFVPRAERMVGVSGLTVAMSEDNEEALGSQWFYELDGIAVNVIYTPYHDLWDVTEGAWHPKAGTGRINVHDFSRHVRVPE